VEFGSRGGAFSATFQDHVATIHRFTMSLAKRDPSDFLKTVIGRPVVVKLNSGVDYRGARHARACSMPLLCARPSTCIFWVVLSLAGVLACLDGYMNIAMEQTEEYVNGQLKAKYGDTFIRGNNGMPRKRALSTPHMHLLCVRLAAAQSCT